MELDPKVESELQTRFLPWKPGISPEKPGFQGRNRVGRRLLGMFAATLLLASGCATTSDLLPGGDAPPTGKVAQVSAVWHNQVIFAPDPKNNGQMTPGIAGKIYLFGPNSAYPLVGHGSIVVELFDLSQKGPDGGPLRLNYWELKNEKLAERLQRDMIGWGYALLLPWLEYRPDLQEVVMKVHYDEPKALPIYSEPTKIAFSPTVQDFQSVKSTRPVMPQQSTGIVPVGNQVPATSR
jgi:hypothetical protein